MLTEKLPHDLSWSKRVDDEEYYCGLWTPTHPSDGALLPHM